MHSHGDISNVLNCPRSPFQWPLQVPVLVPLLKWLAAKCCMIAAGETRHHHQGIARKKKRAPVNPQGCDPGDRFLSILLWLPVFLSRGDTDTHLSRAWEQTTVWGMELFAKLLDGFRAQYEGGKVPYCSA